MQRATVEPQRALALVGPGRAGTTVALALVGARLDGRSRSPAARPTPRRRVGRGRRLGAPAVEVADAGRDADLVIVATPDAAIADAAAALAPARCAPARWWCTSPARARSRSSTSCRPRGPTSRSVRSTRCSRCRRPSSASRVSPVRGARSTGPPSVERLALSLGLRPFRRRAADRGPRTTRPRPSRPTTSSRCSARRSRVAEAAGVPPEALLPLVRASRRQRRRARAPATRSPDRSRAATPTPSPATSTRSPPDERARLPRARRARRSRLSGRDDRATSTTLLDGEACGDHGHHHRRGPRRVRRRARRGRPRRLRADDGVLPRRPPVADARRARRQRLRGASASS